MKNYIRKNETVKRKTTCIYVDAKLLAAARIRGYNLSALVEEHLFNVLEQEKQKEKENRIEKTKNP